MRSTVSRAGCDKRTQRQSCVLPGPCYRARRSDGARKVCTPETEKRTVGRKRCLGGGQEPLLDRYGVYGQNGWMVGFPTHATMLVVFLEPVIVSATPRRPVAKPSSTTEFMLLLRRTRRKFPKFQSVA